MTPDPSYARIEAAFVSPQVDQALAALSEEQNQRLFCYWVDRAEGELTTALSFEFMLADLAAEGAPEALLSLARRAIADEHLHADWCLRWAARVQPDGAVPRARLGGTRPLGFQGANEHGNRILRTVFGCCFSETIAVHVLRAAQQSITVDAVRRLNHQHLKEEIHHARLGWALLSWPGLSARDHDLIASFTNEMASLSRTLWTSTPRPADAALEALGFLSTPRVTQACDEALRDVILPGLAHCAGHCAS